LADLTTETKGDKPAHAINAVDVLWQTLEPSSLCLIVSVSVTSYMSWTGTTGRLLPPSFPDGESGKDRWRSKADDACWVRSPRKEWRVFRLSHWRERCL